METGSNRPTFKSNFGAILALAGSAVGLGNIWKFPYMVGTNGGSAFLIVYLIAVLAIGFPLVITEFVVGRRSKKNSFGAFKKLAPNTKWYLFGALPILISTLVLSYYGTICAWTLEYTWLSLINSFEGKTALEINEMYNNFITHPYEPVLWQFIFMSLTALIIMGGVQRGIERASKIMMPILFILLIALCINSVLLPNSSKGIEFLFYPHFSNLTGQSVLAALGQAFFSLSIGMGCQIIYSSYLSSKDNLTKTVSNVILMDTGVAFIAGLAIFPAVFSFNINPEAGPGLAFITLPQAFQNIPAGEIWSVLFFILLTFAALTSAISLMEISVIYLMEEKKLKRRTATLISTSVITFLGIFSTLSFGPMSEIKIFGLTLFETIDYLTSNILLPVSGILLCIFAGWYMDKAAIYDELSNQGTIKVRFFKVYSFILKYIAPICILAILLNVMGIL